MYIYICIYREKYPHMKILPDDLCVIIDMHSSRELVCITQIGKSKNINFKLSVSKREF